jgi:hypothetical protein
LEQTGSQISEEDYAQSSSEEDYAQSQKHIESQKHIDRKV